MATTVLPGSIETGSRGRRGMRTAVVSALGIWLLLVASLGSAGAFISSPGQPPLPLALAIVSPLLLFWMGLRLLPAFRQFVLALDLRLIAGMQAWRWAGLGFLSLYAHHILPGVFAFPAGLGDMAVGATAPWVVLALARRPDFAASSAFLRWNLFGMLDLLVAVSIGTVDALLTTGAAGEISTGAMASLPLLLIPAFLVPLFFMLHVAALMQRRQLIRIRA